MHRLQENFLQLMDHVAKLFSSPQGLSAAIYTQVSDIEAEVNGKLALYFSSMIGVSCKHSTWAHSM